MKKILLQLDTDLHPSSFDAVTAIDAGIDFLLPYPHVTASNVVPLVQGSIFTRGPQDLKNTAVFIGGSDVSAGEAVLRKVQESFFGPMRVSVIMDSNGCNTTAAAAVIYLQKHLPLQEVKAVVLGGTGPVGSRVASILVSQGAAVTIVSRRLDKAVRTCNQFSEASRPPQAAEIPADGDYRELLQDNNTVIAAGAAGVEFVGLEELQKQSQLQVVMDLNAVPPLGIQGISSTDKARQVDHLVCYGAVGIGGLKMKIHRKLISQLFEQNDQVFDTPEIFSAAMKMV